MSSDVGADDSHNATGHCSGPRGRLALFDQLSSELSLHSKFLLQAGIKQWPIISTSSHHQRTGGEGGEGGGVERIFGQDCCLPALSLRI